METPKRTLMTILVGNTAVNVLLFATTYILFNGLAQRFGAWVTPVSGVASVLLVVVLGEVVPKVLGVALANRLAPSAGVIVGTADTVLGPLGRLIDFLMVEPLMRVAFGRKRGEGANHDDLSPDELKALLEMSRQRGVIDAIEDGFLREVIDLGTLRVRDIMVPRVEVEAFDIARPADELRALMRETRLKKIPVYERFIDNIVGVVHAKILFLQPEVSLRKVVQPVHFVPEVISLEQLLQHFRRTGSQMAIVVDEYGGMAGVVTLEDALEEIVGELYEPEEELEPPEMVPLGDAEYEISGSLSVHYWMATFGLPRRWERFATVGGLVLAQLGRPPRVGDRVRFSNLELEVRAVRRRRIETLRLRLLGDAPDEGEAA